jgi:DNA invertase Pin-like site-specific DNA recombinase
MASTDERDSLREALAAGGAAGKRGYLPEVRQRAEAYARRRREEGLRTRAVAAELGVHESTVRRWCGPKRPTGKARLARVDVVAGLASTGGLSVVSPSGFRLEGLELKDALDILRTLG